MRPTLKMEKRLVTPRRVMLTVPVLSIVLALLAIAFVFIEYGVDPLYAYTEIFVGSFGSVYGLSETIVKAIPLILCGLGLTVAFKALVWNIGAEGQLLLGAIAATGIALYAFPDAPPMVVIPSMFATGFLSGALWGVIPAILKAKLRANEVITTLMMNYIASNLVDYLVYGPWKGLKEWGFPYTDKFSPSAWLPVLPPLVPGMSHRIHYPTLILALTLAVVIYALVMKTKLGYEIRVTGENPDAAKYAGMSYFKTIVLAMLISGGIAGLAGVGEVAGVHYRLRYARGISPGYGFIAIIVAWLGRLNPLAIIPSSLLFGGLLVGGDAIQVSLGLPVAAIGIFNGVILFFVVGAELLMRYKITLQWGREG